MPMHDGIMVPGSKVKAADEAMTEATAEVVGKRIPVLPSSLI